MLHWPLCESNKESMTAQSSFDVAVLFKLERFLDTRKDDDRWLIEIEGGAIMGNSSCFVFVGQGSFTFTVCCCLMGILFVLCRSCVQSHSLRHKKGGT